MSKALYFLLPLCFLIACNTSSKQFEILQANKTNIDFINAVPESDSLNIIINNYMYNGAGVGIADFNNDGLQDVFFAGNLVNNSLYLNKGKLKFKDISETAGILGRNQWCSGVNIFDINNDGLKDIYITATYHNEESKRKNLLFVNQGINSEGVPTFDNQAIQYGLDDTGFSTHSLAFDYDNDGDLDMYLLNNKLDIAKTGGLNAKYRRGDTPSNDKLLRNDNGKFTDVTYEANIRDFGFGLGIALIDANDDFWPDLYISNDFVTNDLLYINQKDGTFKNEISKYTNHQSFSSMGNDIADINNDGLEDIFTLDMLPREDARMKMMFGGMNHYYYDIMLSKKYELEYARNAFQLNRGNGKYSDISMISDLHNTDWSWSILMQDFTNDGLKDMFISNGFPRDITDLDFSDYHSGINIMRSVTQEVLDIIPQVKIPNTFVENRGNLHFQDVSNEWSDKIPSYSNGAAYGDLDNDGDLDLIVSNINDPIFLYENKNNSPSNYIQISLDVPSGSQSISKIGTKVYCYSDSIRQMQVFQPNRGYCSTSQDILHFGFGNSTLDSIKVLWPDGKIQIEIPESINKKLAIAYKPTSRKPDILIQNQLFTKIDSSSLDNFVHQEKRFYDFDIQALVQSLDSEKGPAIAVGDLDKNGTEDLVLGGNTHYPTLLAFQNKDGMFEIKELNKPNTDVGGILIFDIDQDGWNDIFFTQGSSEINDYIKFRNRVFINQKNGAFVEDKEIVEADEDFGNSNIAACDFDKDGDLDLFLGGHSIPAKFPLATKPQLLINENGKLINKFDDYFKLNEGNYLTSSAIWSDVDNDSWPDLITVGKWNPIIVHSNRKGKSFDSNAVSKSHGLWTSISGTDLDNDGDQDYIIGNQGLNNKYRLDNEHPIKLYAKDFDTNGSIDLIMSHFVEGEYRPYHVRNDVTKQLKSLSKIFKDYKSYAEANTEMVLTNLDTAGMKYYKVETLHSSVLRNNGGVLSLEKLPYKAQFSCIHGIITKDVNEDGYSDIISVGNDFGTEVFSGRTDACYGNIILSHGKYLEYLEPYESNFYASGNTRGIVPFKSEIDGSEVFIVARNNDSPLLYSLSKDQISIQLPDDAFRFKVLTKSGNEQIHEHYKGSSYFSQLANTFFFNPDQVQSITSINTRGEETQIYPSEPI